MIARRRLLISGLGAAVVLRVARAQQTKNFARIGFLSTIPLASITRRTEAFRQGLRSLGYVEGQNINIAWRSADETWDRLPALAAELVNMKLDVIVAGESSAAVALRQATQTIPIVVANSSDPIGLGLVASLARPGGNVTGLASVQIDLYGKQVGILKELLPKLKRLAVLSSPANPNTKLVLRQLETAARSLGLQIQNVQVREAKDLAGAFSAMTKERVEALVVIADPLFLSQRTEIADLATRGRLPAIYGVHENVEAGGLIGYTPNRVDQYRRVANFVDKILKGTNPANIPVEQATRFDLVINLKTAKALGLTIPQPLLLRADDVIQ